MSCGTRLPHVPRRWRRSSASSACAHPPEPVALLRDEAHVAAALEDAPRHVVDRRDLLHAHLLRDLVFGEPFALQVALDQIAVLDDDDRLTLQHPSRAPRSEAEVRAAD